ncbi:MAG: hypothetical protein IE916_00410 [Epsilonproteobacteria bacterium]|nr:hypothetical protein [Campylobacterota bacterium]
MKTLILTEKRDAGAELASTLGEFGTDLDRIKAKGKADGFIESENFIVCWAAGHLFEQCMPEAIRADFALFKKLDTPLAYRMEEMRDGIRDLPSGDKTKKRQITILRNLFRRNDISRIISAVDADAEGEGIAAGMLSLGGHGKGVPILRFWNTGSFKSKTAVQKAMNELQPYDAPKYKALYHSYLARSVCDYLLGMKLTKVASEHYNKMFIFGRVKAVITSLVGMREIEIANFKPEPFWSMSAKFGDLELSHFYFVEEQQIDQKTGENKTTFLKEKNYIIRADIDKVLADLAEHVNKVEIKKIEVRQTSSKTRPLPLSGSDFASEMMGKFKITYNQCNDMLQYLRDNGFTTYQGTNGRYFSPDDEADVVTALGTANTYFQVAGNFDKSSYIFNGKKAAKQNHPPLHLTGSVPSERDINKWANDKLPHIKEGYETIAKRILVAFLEDDLIEEQHLLVSTPGGYFFELRGRKAIKQGWRSFIGEEIKDTTFDVNQFNVGNTITLSNIEVSEGMTKKPLLYTEKTLLDVLLNVTKVVDGYIKEAKTPNEIKKYKKMKKLLKEAGGIGTDRTRSDIISSLFKNGVFRKNGKGYITLTESGQEIFNIYPRLLKSVEFAASWENVLESIRQGKTDYKDFIKSVDDVLMDKMIPEIINGVGGKVQAVGEREKVIRNKLAGAICPLCGKGVDESDKQYTCENVSFGKSKGCAFKLNKDLAKTLGRKLDGLNDFNAFVTSTETSPMKENAHAIYFNPSNKKYFFEVIWENAANTEGSSGGNTVSAGNSSAICETAKTFKKGNEYFFKNLHGGDITMDQAKKLFDGEEVQVSRKNKEDKKYTLSVKYKGEPMLETAFVNNSIIGGSKRGKGRGKINFNF